MLLVVIGVLLAAVVWQYTARHTRLAAGRKLRLQQRIAAQERRLQDARARARAAHAADRARVVRQPPEVAELRRLCEEFDFSSHWACLLRVGDIYRTGAFPRFKPNQAMAERCYKVASECPDADVAGEAIVKFAENRALVMAREDVAGEELPTEHGARICRLATAAMAAGSRSFAVKPKVRAPVVARPAVAPVATAAAVDGADHVMRMLDRQNVHDHAVAVALHTNIKTLEENQAIARRPSLEEIKHALLDADGLSADEKVDALRVLDDLNDGTAHSRLGVTEADALKLVWARIQGNGDRDVRANLTETLGKQLASALEHGSVVCSTGKIARIVGTLDGTDESMAALRPMWVLKDEIASAAGAIRDNVLKEAPADQRRAYEGGGCERLEDEMREQLAAHVLGEYVRLGYAKSVLEPMIAQFAEGF